MSINHRFDRNQHHKTKNKRGFMHPLSDISQQFILYASYAKRPVADIGCAYGNTVIAALNAGVKDIIACDMEKEHLLSLKDEAANSELSSHLHIKQGIFPNGIYFDNDSLDGIHASHLFEYLNGDEVESGLINCYRWLHSGGKLFIVTYSIYILELANDKFRNEYGRRLEAKVKWPGYLDDYDAYSLVPEDDKEEEVSETLESPFPSALHMYDLSVLVKALEATGFIIEFADYLDGSKNAAVKETWNDGREYVGIIARKR